MAPARPRRRPDPTAGSPVPALPVTERDPASEGGASVPELLRHATEEAARLLGADGAFLYLLDPESGRLRFTHDAGIEGLPPDHWVRGLELPVGMGMFGRAVVDRRVVITGDYAADTGFHHAPGPDRLVAELGIRSLVVAPLVAVGEVFGALGTFSRRADAFTAPQVALVRALADHAAIAMANARLIAELARSRAALERQAVVERSLRELGTRISGARDPGAVVQFTIDEALRLLGGDGARIDIVDPEVRLLRGLYSSGEEEILEAEWPRDPDDRLEVGASGRAVVTGRTYVSADYLDDPDIVHGAGPDTYVRNKGIHAVIATPLFGDQGPFGAITVWSSRRDVFGPQHVALLETIAGQSAVALGRARLIEELGRSREALARRAEEERALREIAGRLSRLGDDPGDVLLRIVHEAARLLGAERSRLDLLEPTAGAALWTFPANTPFEDQPILDTPDDALPVGLAALAVREGRAVATGDYAADDRFLHYDLGDRSVAEVELRSIMAAPVVGEAGLLGVIQTGSRRPNAFHDDALRLLEALAGQASIAITNARLVDRLERSQTELGRTADGERALREIARRMMTIQDPAQLLQDVVSEAARLLGSAGAVIDLLDPASGEVRWAHDAGIDDATRAGWQRHAAGMDGVRLAIRERRVIVADRYAEDPRFADAAASGAFFAGARIRSVAFAPLVGEATVLGTLTVFAGEAGRFGDQQAGLLVALADLATIAIHNAELIAELGRSREETARRAETERTLREIAARVTAVRDPDTILALIVDEASRVLASDGAHLTRISEDGTFLRPVVVAGGMDDETRDWLRTQAFPLDGGINGLAATQGRVVWTPSYETDPRIPRDADDLEVARRMGLGAMAAAPLRAPGGEVIGTLAVSYRVPGPIAADRLATLQALADHAAIALSNSDLLARLETSERSYRRLVQATPDVIWRNDAEGRFTFIAEGAEALFGWRPDELAGQHFSFIVAPDTMADAGDAWERLASTPDEVWRLPFVLRHRDGRTFPAEVSAVSSFEDGAFAGAQGTLRDVSERERLERELRASEERYRGLVQSSPDLIFEMDGNGLYTFYSDRTSEVIGWRPDELIGRAFTEFIEMSAFPQAGERLAEIAAHPGRPYTDRLLIRHRDGRPIPFEVSVVGQTGDDGRLVAIRGIARNISERERLERELRSSEERYRFLVENSPDIVFAADAEGRFTYISESIQHLTGVTSAELIGQPFSTILTDDSVSIAIERWTSQDNEPGLAQVLRLELRRKDGTSVPVEIHSVGVPDANDRFAGIHGSARDIGERELLEAELRESEVRYRFLVENSPDIIYATDAEGLITYFSESVERVLGWLPSEVVGRHFRDIVRTAGGVPVGRRFAELARGMADMTTRMELVDKDGVYHPFEVTAAAIRRDGEFAGVHGSARDVGERERLERELRESEGRYRYLVQSSPDLVWMTDEEGRFTFVSDQAEAILGWAREDLLGRSFADLAPAGGRRGAVARFRYLQRRPTEAHRSRIKVLTRDGRELSMEITGIGMVADGRFLGAHGAARDVSERDRLERDLRRQAAELASSEERAHLARELHDSVTQALFSMTLLSRSAELLLQKDPSQVPAKLASLRELQRDALAEMRALIFELRPGNIEEAGLVQALRTHSAALSGRIGLPVVVEADLPERPPIEVEETLYRIAQEALHNIVKHAGARQVRLEVGRAADGVRLRVVDDGRGFDPTSVADGHLGLAGMLSRAERLGGRLTVSSVAGQGTTIEVVVPAALTGRATAAD